MKGVCLVARKNGQIAESDAIRDGRTPEALRSPPMTSRESRRLLSSTPFQSSYEECRLRRREMISF
jgi:hypothetical protein